MLSTTPAGCRTVIDSVPGLSVGIVSPWIWVASPAASRNNCAVRKALKPAQSWAAPTSDIIVSTNSGVRRSMMSAALSMTARRSLGPDSDHDENALDADSTASMASSTLAAAPSVTTSPVSGFRRSNVRPSWASRLSLSMISCVCMEPSLSPLTCDRHIAGQQCHGKFAAARAGGTGSGQKMTTGLTVAPDSESLKAVLMSSSL